MSSPRVYGLAALLLIGVASAAIAEDKPVTAPAGQSEAGRGDARLPAVEAPAADAKRADDPPPGDPSQSAARSPEEDRSDELERARDAARKADPRLLGLERAREAARKADPSGGVDCLSAREARGAIVAKRAVTLSQALRTARDAWDGEVIDYRLCTFDGALAYDLTLLNTEGRVARVRVEAANGKLVGVR